MHYHDDLQVNHWVEVLLRSDFENVVPFSSIDPFQARPLSYGQTLLLVNDRFGEAAALAVNLLQH